MKPSHQANSYLLIVSVFFGVTFPLIKAALPYMNAHAFVFYRLILACIVLLPIVGRNLLRINWQLLLASLILGAINSGMYIFQTISMEMIPASRSAFIVGINILIVPFLLPLFRMGFPRKADIASVFICLIGLYILTGASLTTLSLGDWWSAASALATALMIVFVQWVSPRVENYGNLTFYQFLFSIPIIALSVRNYSPSALLHPIVIMALLFCGIFASALSLYWMTKYQHQTTATTAAIIYNLEPVFAAIFAVLVGQEILSYQTLLGGGIILTALIFPALVNRKKNATAMTK